MPQASSFVPGCGGDAAENKATLHYSWIRQASHLRVILAGLQLFHASSVAHSVYKTFGVSGGRDCDCPFVSYFKLVGNASVNICHQPD